MVGHQSVQVTLELYNHLMPELGLKKRAAAHPDPVLAPSAHCGQHLGQMEQGVVSPSGIEPREAAFA